LCAAATNKCLHLLICVFFLLPQDIKQEDVVELGDEEDGDVAEDDWLNPHNNENSLGSDNNSSSSMFPNDLLMHAPDSMSKLLMHLKLYLQYSIIHYQCILISISTHLIAILSKIRNNFLGRNVFQKLI